MPLIDFGLSLTPLPVLYTQAVSNKFAIKVISFWGTWLSVGRSLPLESCFVNLVWVIIADLSFLPVFQQGLITR